VLTFVGGGRIRLDDVAKVLGALPDELRFELAEALAAHRVGEVFACVERVAEAGHDLHQFAREALEHTRDLYVTKVAPSSATLVDATAERRERLAAQAERFGPGELGRVVRILGDLYLDLRTATDQRLVLEVGLARAALPEASLDADALLARIERLERRLAIGQAESATGTPAPRSEVTATPPRPSGREEAGSRATSTGEGAAAAESGKSGGRRRAGAGETAADGPPADNAAPPRGGRRQAAPEPKRATSRSPRQAAEEPAPDWAAPPAPAAPVDLDLVVRSWPLVLEKVRAASRVVATFLDHGRPVALEGRQVVVEFPEQARFYADALGQEGRSRRVDAAMDAVLGGDLEIRIRLGQGSVELAVDEPAPAGQPAPSDLVSVEFEVDPDNDAGEELDADADARAVADWAAQQLGGEVIEERPNDAETRRGSAPKKRGSGGSGTRRR
jgi:DNA polymerase III subunit gamma/tau